MPISLCFNIVSLIEMISKLSQKHHKISISQKKSTRTTEAQLSEIT